MPEDVKTTEASPQQVPQVDAQVAAEGTQSVPSEVPATPAPQAQAAPAQAQPATQAAPVQAQPAAQAAPAQAQPAAAAPAQAAPAAFDVGAARAAIGFAPEVPAGGVPKPATLKQAAFARNLGKSGRVVPDEFYQLVDAQGISTSEASFVLDAVKTSQPGTPYTGPSASLSMYGSEFVCENGRVRKASAPEKNAKAQGREAAAADDAGMMRAVLEQGMVARDGKDGTYLYGMRQGGEVLVAYPTGKTRTVYKDSELAGLLRDFNGGKAWMPSQQPERAVNSKMGNGFAQMLASAPEKVTSAEYAQAVAPQAAPAEAAPVAQVAQPAPVQMAQPSVTQPAAQAAPVEVQPAPVPVAAQAQPAIAEPAQAQPAAQAAPAVYAQQMELDLDVEPAADTPAPAQAEAKPIEITPFGVSDEVAAPEAQPVFDEDLPF